MIGQTVSHYRICEQIGAGGMGVVYRAEDERLGRPVALKFLPAHLVADPTARDRFLTEARTASALDHPNVCVVHEIDELRTGEVFIAMAFYDGETVEQRIDGGPLSVEDAVGLGCQVAEGLSAAHQAGIVHRDVKPANLIVTWDGVLKILDFGIAKLSSVAGHTKKTGAVGTLAYAAPEQLDTGDATPRSDVWSVGVVLYEMLTGRLPFDGSTPIAMLHQVLMSEPRPVREVRPEVPLALAAAVEAALSKDPGSRPADAAAFLELLRGAYGSTAPPPEVAFRGAASTIASPSLPPFLHPEVPAEDRSQEAFVGRERELARLRDWLHETAAGHGRVVFVRGEAGSGKTALVREFSRRAAVDDPDLTVAIGECNAYTGPGDPYRPFREILGQLTGDVEAQWAGGGLSSLHAARLWGLLPEASTALLRSGPHLTSTFLVGSGLLQHGRAHGGVSNEILLELEGLAKGDEGLHHRAAVDQADLCDEYVRVLRDLVRDRTLVLVVDDLQWADTASVQLFFEITRHLAATRLMLVGLYRPSEVAMGREGRRHPLEPLLNEVTSRQGDVTIEFGDTEGRSFVDAVLDAEPNRLGDDFRSAMLRQAGGNALFTVELYRSLRESGVVIEDDRGRWSTGETPIDWHHLPARVEAVVAERLARLAPDLKRLLSLASVEGERFTLEVLARMEGADPRSLLRVVNHDLRTRHRLVIPDGLRQVSGRRLSTYRFRHILFQRHLYDRLDPAERAYAHEQVADALAALHGERDDLIALPLSHHYRQAGRIEEACGYLEVAGMAALGGLAFREALTHFETGLGLTLTLPPSQDRDRRELTFQTLVGETGITLATPGIEDAFRRALDLANEVGTPEEIFRATGGLYGWQHYAGHWEEPLELGEHCLAIARREGDQRLLAAGLAYASHAALYSAEFDKTIAYVEELVSFYDPVRHASDLFIGGVDIGVMAPMLLATALLRRGHVDQAYTEHDRAGAMAVALGDGIALHVVHFFAARDLIWLEDFEAAQARLEACIALQEETGAHGLLASAPILARGWCDLHQGDAEGGLARIEGGLAGWPYRGFRASYLGELAAAQARCGRAVDRLAEFQASIAVPEENGPLYRGRVYRLYGDVLATLSEPALGKAEEAYRKAIRVCEAHGDRVDGLAASIALAEFLADTDRRGEGQAALRKAYNAFPEGHPAPLLQRAKAALSEGEARSLQS